MLNAGFGMRNKIRNLLLIPVFWLHTSSPSAGDLELLTAFKGIEEKSSVSFTSSGFAG
jgi:hypothetical protein